MPTDDDQRDDSNITPEEISIAHSIVMTSLSQLCK